MPPKASKRKATNGYRLPDPIPKGEIFLDGKNRWRIGKSIGVGGFGEIYLCSSDTEHEVKDTANTVMKVEPSENGPLFVEMHFYVRAATATIMEAYKKEKGLKEIGIPCFRGKGLHNYKGQSYRFLVIDRYGKDLQKIFQTGKKTFSPKAAYNLAIRCMDALEYIHAQGYVHNDLKAQNLLLGHGRSKENDVFLVDFGLVSKYKVNGVHIEYKPDARRAHDGTIEYTSRDAHIGAHARRSDLEILGYNLVHWMSGNLPWMNNLTNPVYVHTQKKGFMSDIPSFLRNCFGDENDYPEVLEKFLNYTVGLEFDTKPDYDYCRSLFKDELRRLRLPSDGKIDFSASSRSQQKKVGKSVLGGSGIHGDEVDGNDSASDEEDEVVSPRSSRASARRKGPVDKKKQLRDTGVQTSPAFVKAAKAAAKAKKKTSAKRKSSSLSEIEEDEMEAFVDKSMKAARKALSDNNNSSSAPKKRTSSPTKKKKKKEVVADDSDDGLDNPTPAMLAVMQKRKTNEKKSSKRTKN